MNPENYEQTIQALKQQVEILTKYIKARDSGHETMIEYAKAQLEARTNRKWEGLTPQELNAITEKMRTWNSFDITDIYFAIEAKLKEKNK